MVDDNVSDQCGPNMSGQGATPVIRVVMQQPALPKYRVPVFNELAHRPGIKFTLYYDTIPDGPPNAERADFAAQVSPMRWRRIRWHHAMWKYATRNHADVLILSWNLNYCSLVPSLLRAKVNGVSTILWGHGYSKNETALRAWLRYQTSRLADALLFYNHSTAKWFLEHGADPDRVFVAINSLDQEPIREAQKPWRQEPERLAKFRNQHGLQGPVILFVSRLCPENRLDMLLNAGTRILTKYPTLKIVIIGEGSSLASLKKQAAQLQIGDNVSFLGAMYEENDLAPWFLASDVFCYPANIGLSLLHAFGYGLPVVTTDDITSQNPEIEALKHNVNGVLYEDNNIESLASALDALLSSPSTRRSMGEAALHTVETEFSLSRMVDGMESAIRYCVRRVTAGIRGS